MRYKEDSSKLSIVTNSYSCKYVVLCNNLSQDDSILYKQKIYTYSNFIV